MKLSYITTVLLSSVLASPKKPRGQSNLDFSATWLSINSKVLQCCIKLFLNIYLTKSVFSTSYHWTARCRVNIKVYSHKEFDFILAVEYETFTQIFADICISHSFSFVTFLLQVEIKMDSRKNERVLKKTKWHWKKRKGRATSHFGPARTLLSVSLQLPPTNTSGKKLFESSG